MQQNLKYIFIILSFMVFWVECFSQKIGDSKEISNLNNKAKELLNSDLDKSYQLSKQALSMAQNAGNKKEIGNAYINIGLYYFRNSDRELALKYYDKAHKLFSELGDSVAIAAVWVNHGMFYDIQGDFSKSLKFYNKALDIYRRKKNDDGISITTANIARIYFKSQDYKKALDFMQQDLRLQNKKGNQIAAAYLMSNMAAIYGIQGNIKLAMSNYDSLLVIYSKLKNLQGLAGTYHNIGSLLAMENKTLKAKYYFEKALVYADSIKDDEIRAETYANLAELNLKLKNYSECLSQINSTEEIGIKMNNLKILMQAYELRAEIFEATGQFGEALTYYKKYKELSDSIYSRDMGKQLSDFKIRYETEAKERRIEALTQESAISELTIKRQNIILGSAIIVFLLLIAVVLLFQNRYRLKRKTAMLLEEANNQLMDANATKDKIFSIVAHDMKNPAQAFHGILNLIIENYNQFDDNKKLELLNKLNQSSKGIISLVDNVSQWSKLRKGTHVFSPESVPIFDVLERVCEVLSSQAQAKNITVNNFAVADHTMFADVNMLFTVMCNIISNALKFTPENGQITIKSEQENDFTILNITDTGVGISEEKLGQLFKMDTHFTSIGTNKEKGSGLGLLICKDFVEKCDGTIAVNSKIGEGTTVTLRLHT